MAPFPVPARSRRRAARRAAFWPLLAAMAAWGVGFAAGPGGRVAAGEAAPPSAEAPRDPFAPEPVPPEPVAPGPSVAGEGEAGVGRPATEPPDGPASVPFTMPTAPAPVPTTPPPPAGTGERPAAPSAPAGTTAEPAAVPAAGENVLRDLFPDPFVAPAKAEEATPPAVESATPGPMAAPGTPSGSVGETAATIGPPAVAPSSDAGRAERRSGTPASAGTPPVAPIPPGEAGTLPAKPLPREFDAMAAPRMSGVSVPTSIVWYGHACFSITFTPESGPSYTAVIDPYGPGMGYPAPSLRADDVFLSHDHADHNHLAAVKPRAGAWEKQSHAPHEDGDTAGSVRRSFLYRFSEIMAADAKDLLDGSPREPMAWTCLKDRALAGMVRARHWEDPRHADRGETALTFLSPLVAPAENASVREAATPFVLHLGDLGQAALAPGQIAPLADAQWFGSRHFERRRRAVDILMIPVGGVYTIDAEQAARIVGQLRPRVVVPMHYQTDALDMGEIALAPLDDFLARLSDEYERRRPKTNAFQWPIPELAENDKARKADETVPLKRLVIALDWRAALSDPRLAAPRASPHPLLPPE